MAKIIHNNFIDTVNDLFGEAKKRQVMHLTHDHQHWDGKMHIDNRQLVNFGTCGYLGLETDQRLKDRAAEYVQRYGTQFSISRAYVINHEVKKLEGMLERIFDGRKTLVFSSTTLTHIGVLPIVIDPTDAIILDQQSHFSIQNAANLMATKGVPIEMIRHSNLEMLEKTIKRLGDKYTKIWYMIDGVYSMYGDLPPIEELNRLCEKYPQFHLYIDDAHGIGWTGRNGCGYVFDRIKDNGKTILISTLAKGFGSTGGIAVFPDQETYDKVFLFGGPLGYSHPLPPAVLGASIAAAEIMLSDEIYFLQDKLREKMDYCNSLLDEGDYPVMSDPNTPIYFVGSGQPNVGYNLNNRLIQDGFYVNLAIFPAVSMKNTGLRFTITEHVSKRDIYNFVQALNYHYPAALESEGKTCNEVRRAFKMPLLDLNTGELEKITNKADKDKLSLKQFKTIKEIDPAVWNSLSKEEGHYDHEGMIMLEKTFTGNDLEEHNWEFHYLMVVDSNDRVIASTFFSSGLLKDDLLAYAEVSKQIEEQRLEDPYYLTSKALVMGSMFSEGDHLHYDEEHPQYLEAIRMMLEQVSVIQDENGINTVILRDFPIGHIQLEKLFHDFGYAKVNMPNANNIYELQRNPEKEFVETLTKRSRRHIRTEVLRNSDLFEFEVKEELTDEEHEQFYQMYLTVARKNLAVNTFTYPRAAFRNMNELENWEFVVLRLKEGNEYNGIGSIQAIGCCYCIDENYIPLLLGLDYSFNSDINSYKQFLYQITLNARNRGFKNVFFGYSADVEKKKLGAHQVQKLAFMLSKDTFNQEIINQMANIS